MELKVMRPGMLTTVQDLGRPGMRAEGIPAGGAMDAPALRIANLLVGNEECAAGLEVTLVGPEIEFAAETLIAFGGAEFESIPNWRPFRMRAGERLHMGPAVRGCRGYMAVAGGIAVETVLGGRGTHLQAGIGGLEGRALRAGDVLPTPQASRKVIGRWHLDERILPEYGDSPVVRIVRGAHERELGNALLTESFTVTNQSDRMGIRLEAAAPMRSAEPAALSGAVLPGSIQLPPDGQPIVLMADAQTLGGYPLIGHVIGPDLALLAQVRAGDKVTFREVSLDEAHALALARDKAIGLLRHGLAEKFA